MRKLVTEFDERLAVSDVAGSPRPYREYRRHVDGESAVRGVTIAKLATQTAFSVMDSCLQTTPAAARWCNRRSSVRCATARLGPIGGGTDEIMKEILGRSLGL